MPGVVAVDMGQALMLALSVPAMCLLLFLLVQVEKWLENNDDWAQQALMASGWPAASPHAVPPEALKPAGAGGGSPGGEGDRSAPLPSEVPAETRALIDGGDSPGTASPGGCRSPAADPQRPAGQSVAA